MAGQSTGQRCPQEGELIGVNSSEQHSREVRKWLILATDLRIGKD